MKRDWIRYVLVGLCLVMMYALEARDLKRVLRAIEKGDYPKTIELIEEALALQPVNPGVKYVLAELMTYDSLPIYNMDSARIRIREAMDDYAIATYDDLEELSKNGIGIDDFEGLASKIERMHYQRALHNHGVADFEEFMDLYPLSDRVPHFVRLRDSLVWEDVRPRFSVQEHKDFMQTYPRSHLVPAVKVAYDSLLFFNQTAGDKLEDYQAFLRDNPETPFRERIEQVLFRRMTASDDPEDIRAFIDAYDNQALKIKAFDIGYHLDPDFDFTDHPRADSLWEVDRQDQRTLTTVMINGKYSFMNSLGAKVRNVAIERTPEDYVCGSIDSDIVIGLGANGAIYNRLGAEIFRGNILEARDLGLGVLLVRASGKRRLIHKSGFTIMEGLSDAEVVGDQWIKAKVDGQYGLMSISGYAVTGFKYDDIWKEGSFWVFEKDGLLAVYTTDKIMERLYDQVLELEFKFDDLEIYRDTLIIGFRGERECLMDGQLDFLIPWGEHRVSPGWPYHYSRTDAGYELHGDALPLSSKRTYEKLQDTDAWTAVQSEGSWSVMNKLNSEDGFVAVDSAHLVGNENALVVVEGKHLLLFPEGDTVALDPEQLVTAMIPLEAGTPARFLLISGEDDKQVYGTDGRLIFEGDYDEIKPLNDSLFVIEERGLLGVIDAEGTKVVSQRYEAAQVANGMIFLLRDGKIGGYDLRTKTAFANKYESRLEPMGPYFATTVDGKMGLIDEDEDVIVPFDYEDISFFNDTIFWLKEEMKWSLVDIEDMEPLLEEVTRFGNIAEGDGGDILVFYGEDGNGLLGPDANVILPPKFNSIHNVGSPTDPIFFVEEYSQLADFYIVTYLNAQGERLESFGYRPEDFERVICED